MQNNTILLVCDDEALCGCLREKLIIGAGYSLSLAHTPQGTMHALAHNGFDLAIVRLPFAGMDGLSLLRQIKEIDRHMVIIAFIDEEGSSLAHEAASLGIYGIVHKPFDFEKVTLLAQKGIELHALLVETNILTRHLNNENASLLKQNNLLADRIEESTKSLTALYKDLRDTYMRTIKVLAHAIDARDHYTHSHSENVGRYAVLIAEQIGLPLKDIESIRDACALHDLGKIGIDDRILSKPGSLTEEEWSLVRRHPLTAAEILEPLTFLGQIMELVKQHHERFDGSGYPLGLKGDNILLGARVINLADAYEAMRAARSYRKVPLSHEEAMAEIVRNSGTQFDPGIVEAFLKVADKL